MRVVRITALFCFSIFFALYGVSYAYDDQLEDSIPELKLIKSIPYDRETNFKPSDYLNLFTTAKSANNQPMGIGEVPLNMKFNNNPISGKLNIPAGGKASFSFDENACINVINSKVSTILGNQVSGVSCEGILHLYVYTWDKSDEFPNRINKTVISDKDQVLEFNFPTDPFSIKIFSIAFFKYNALGVGASVAPVSKWCYGVEWNEIIVYDEEPPSSVAYSSPVLFTTTGGKISEFNKRAEEYDFKHPNPSFKIETKNPEILEVFVKDNNYFAAAKPSDLASGTPLRFGTTNPDLAFYVERYVTFYKKTDTPSSVNKIEKMIGETVDNDKLGTQPATPEGRFEWVGPIWGSDLVAKGWKIERYQRESVEENGLEKIVEVVVDDGVIKNKSKCCSVFRYSGPITALEKAIDEAVQAKSGETDASRYNLHFASLSQMFIPALAGDNTHFLEHTVTDAEAGIENEKIMRIFTATIDNSGNVSYPVLSQKMPEFLVLKDFNDKFGSSKVKMTVKCNDKIAVIPYDDRLPNPLISVTNTETNVTSVFRMPNSDCLAEENASAASPLTYFPYAEQADVWHFKYDDSTPAMKWLKQKDPKRYDEYVKALKINEDVRLIFDMAAHDNISKFFETISSDTVKVGQFGISTPMIGAEKGLENLHFKTWKIIDPTGVESLIYEKKEANEADCIFAYPDYVYRNPESGKSYKVSFYVEDFSPFFNKKNCSMEQPPSARHGNIREVILEFEVAPRAVSSQNMGGSTKTTASEEKKDGKK